MKAQLRKEIQGVFNRLALSFDKKDVSGVVASVLPDAVILYLDATAMPIQKWRAGAKADFSATQSMRSKFKVDKVEPAGKNAMAWYTETHDYVFKGDKKLRYCSLNKWSAVLTKTSKGWKIRYFVQLFEAIKVIEFKNKK